MPTSTRVSGVVVAAVVVVLAGPRGRRARRRRRCGTAVSAGLAPLRRDAVRRRRCRPSSGRRRPTDAALGIRARKGRVRSALKVAEFGAGAAGSPEAGRAGASPTPRRRRCWPTRCGRPVSSTRRTAATGRPSPWRPTIPARASGWPARWPRRASCRQALDEALAASAAVAARRRHPRRHRRHLRADEPLRRGRQLLHQLHQPAAQQGPQREGGLGARPGAVPRVVRGPEARGRGRGGPADAAHDPVPPGEGQDHRPGPGERRPRAWTSRWTPAPRRR